MAIPPPPPIVAPAPIAFGALAVRLGAGTRSIEVEVDGRITQARAVAPGPRRVRVRLAAGEHRVRVRARGAGAARWSAPVTVRVLPATGRALGRLPGLRDARLQRDIEGLAGGLPAISGVYVQHLATGCGAGVNAGAQFPAASTLKAAIMVEAVRRARGRPAPDAAGLLDRMIVNSNDLAANALLAAIGDGSDSVGGARVTETMARLGLSQSLIRRGYIIENAGRPIPVEAVARPALYTNYITTPFELTALMVAIHRGTVGRGGVAKLGLAPAVVRREMTLRLLRVADRTKLVAGLPAGAPVAHKTGYTEQVKHDAGVVYLPSGPVAITAMTWSPSGVSDARGNRFIADVARAAVRRLGAGGRCG